MRKYLAVVPPELFGEDIDEYSLLDKLKAFLETSLKSDSVVVRTYVKGDERGLLLLFDNIITIKVFRNIIVVEGKDSKKAKVIFGGVKTFIKELARKRSAGGDIYFVYIPGEEIIPPSLHSPIKRLFQKLFSENMVYLFFTFALISIMIYTLVGPIFTPLVVTLLGLLVISVAPVIIPRLISDWHVPEDMPVKILKITILEELEKRINEDKLLKLKKLLKPLVLQRDLDVEKVKEIIRSVFGVDKFNVELYHFNIYSYVKSVASRFGLCFRGRIYITNTMIRNALSLGYGKNSAIVLTSGILAVLKKDEIKAIIAHETSHIVHRDVLLFFFLASLEYAFRLYYFFIVNPLCLLDPLFVTAYILLTTLLIFMFSKYLEIRADIDTAGLGLGLELANALAKVSFSLGYERNLLERLWDWLRPEPHPPVRYRISYLLTSGKKGRKNSWLTAFFLLVKGVLTVR